LEATDNRNGKNASSCNLRAGIANSYQLTLVCQTSKQVSFETN
jgi:hypothetical protein